MIKTPVLLYKTLVIGVIVLFIGFGIQPAFAVDAKTTISNNQNKDCKNCGEVSESDLIKIEKFLNKVEVYCKLLLVLINYNSELRDMSVELPNQLININKLSDEFNTFILQKSRRPICDILEPLYVITFIIMAFSYEICYMAMLVYHSVLLLIIFAPIFIAATPIFGLLVRMIVKYECNPPI